MKLFWDILRFCGNDFHTSRIYICMSQEDHSLPRDVRTLQAMLLQREDAISQYRATLFEHRAELLQHRTAVEEQRNELEQQREANAQQEAVIAQQHDTIAEQQQTIQRQEERIAKLLRQQYGPRRERIDPDQLLLFTEEELEQIIAELKQDSEDENEPPRKKPKRKGHGRRPLPAHLPREQVVHELSAEELPCPCCGELREEIGSETSEQLEVVPATVKVIEHVRKKYACRHCEEQVETAAKPPQPIDKGLPGPGLLAHTVLGKFGDHLPLYRQEDILARHGVVIRRSTLCDWMAAAAELARPLWNLMRQRILLSRVIHTDDTPVQMLAPGQTKKTYFWVYLGDREHPYSVFDFTEGRGRDGPLAFLDGYSGYVQADAYSGYNELFATGRVTEVGCWAHCRRYWWEARDNDPRRAHEALSYIGRLYALEEQFREAQLTGDALRDARRQHAEPILEAFEQWLVAPEQQRLLPKSTIGEAHTYTSNQWRALRRYTADGVLSIDNNVAERTVKGPAIGRKNYLFVGSRTGGERAAILYSLVASCKANAVEPQAYLTDLFRNLPEINRIALDNPTAVEFDKALEPFLPDRWLAANPEHRWQIDDLRQEERKRSREARIARRKK